MKMDWTVWSRSLCAALALTATTTIAGCYKATFVETPEAAKREPTHDEWTDHYVFGLVGDEEYDTREFCPGGAEAVRTGGNASTTTITILTLGIYAPRKVYVTCHEPKRLASKTTVMQ
jgi:hypothetical protein